jgi:hypothetical protein
MKEIEHLTKNQIAGYRAGAFDVREKREIGRHLLKCEVCRKSLPAPTFDDFWSAVMDEQEAKIISSHSIKRFSMSPFTPLVYAFSLAVVVLFFGAGLVYFIFLGKVNTDLNGQLNTQEQGVETAKMENKPEIKIVDKTGSANVQKTIPSPQIERKTQARVGAMPQQKKLILPNAKNRRDSQMSVQTQDSNREIEIATVRSSNTNSTEKNKPDIVSAELSLIGDQLKLTWSKYPQAVGYSVVISDVESNELIDEIKSAGETDILISLQKFAPLKKYEVKVAAVLPDGTIKTSKTFTFTKNSRKH